MGSNSNRAIRIHRADMATRAPENNPGRETLFSPGTMHILPRGRMNILSPSQELMSARDLHATAPTNNRVAAPQSTGHQLHPQIAPLPSTGPLMLPSIRAMRLRSKAASSYDSSQSSGLR